MWCGLIQIQTLLISSSLSVQTTVYRSANRKNISKSTGCTPFNPQIATSGDNVYLVWEDSTPGSLLISSSLSSTNNGLSFSQPKNIHKNTVAHFSRR